MPYVAVIGDEELESGQLTVTIHSESTPKSPAKRSMTTDELKERLAGETKGKPWRRLPLSMRLSERPRFI